MKKIYNDMGQLNDFGKEVTHDLKSIVQKLLSDANGVAEINTVGSLLMNVVANEITNSKVLIKKKD